MALVSVTCTNCNGVGLISVEQCAGNIISFRKKTCDDCEGAGFYLVHTGSFDSYGTNDESTWSSVWDKLDEDTPRELEFSDRG